MVVPGQTLASVLNGTGEPAALVLAAGDTQAPIYYPSLRTGIAYQQTPPLTFGGSNGLDCGFSFIQVGSSGENDGTAQMNANSTTTPPSLSGVTDINLDFGANLDQPFTGTFSAPTATGPVPGMLVGTNNAIVNGAAFTPQIAVDYYFIDSDHGFFVETDLVNSVPPPTPPTPSGQVSF